MPDPRLTAFAAVLVNYSTEVKPGDFVVIAANGFACQPLVKEVYRLCLAAGASHVEYQFTDPEIGRLFYVDPTPGQLNFFPEHKLQLMQRADVFIGISANENSRVGASCDPVLVSARDRLLRPITDCRCNTTRWVVTRYPTPAAAQDAGMSLEEYTDFVFAASCLDWAAESRKQDALVALMTATDRVRIVASDTDLRFSIKDIPVRKCDGRRNIPDGEVFTAPVRDSVVGHITYNCPTIYRSQEFNNIRLEFAAGRIVAASCPGMDAEMNAILDTDEGARFIGEFAIGVNPGITRPAKDILYDEKIGGSIHFTPGNAYEDADNGNKSAIHWDMVKLLTGDGQIWFDDVLIQDQGRFVHPDLLPLNPPA